MECKGFKVYKTACIGPIIYQCPEDQIAPARGFCNRASHQDYCTHGVVKIQQPVIGKILNTHASGATSSHQTPTYWLMPGEGIKLTAARFEAGNVKHEASTPVYKEANWMKAVKARDVAFFRDRAGHALEHLWAEMRGDDDTDPGGNLGALGWFVEIMAYVAKEDPDLYAAIQGKRRLDK